MTDDLNLILVAILITRIVIVHTIVHVFFLLRNVAHKCTLILYTIAAAAYIYYVSINTIASIPHTLTDLIRVVATGTIVFIMSRFIRRQ